MFFTYNKSSSALQYTTGSDNLTVYGMYTIVCSTLDLYSKSTRLYSIYYNSEHYSVVINQEHDSLSVLNTQNHWLKLLILSLLLLYYLIVYELTSKIKMKILNNRYIKRLDRIDTYYLVFFLFFCNSIMFSNISAQCSLLLKYTLLCAKAAIEHQCNALWMTSLVRCCTESNI